MYQILLVDDEPSVVDSLEVRIPWADLGIEQVYKAYSAFEALEIFKTTPIDIVVTDIRMPGMSGIELINNLRKTKSRTKCILLTGYAEFDYAKQAIQNRTMDYLLKPVSNEDFIQAAKRAIEELHAEWQLIHSHENILKTLKENMPAMKASLFSELLQGKNISAEALKQRMDFLNLPYMVNSPVCMVLIRVDGHFDKFDKGSLDLLDFAISNISEELLGECFNTWHGKDLHDYLVFFVSMKQNSDALINSDDNLLSTAAELIARTASDIQNNVKKLLNGSVSILISQWGIFPKDITTLYNSLLLEIRRNSGSGSEFLYAVHKSCSSMEQPQVKSLKSLYETPMLIHLMESGRWEACIDKLTEIFTELEAIYQNSSEHIDEVLYTLLSTFTSIAHKSSKQLVEITGGDYIHLSQGNPFKSVLQLKEWAFKILQLIQNDLKQDAYNNRSSVVKKVQEFIESRLADDVSLQTIADHVYLNPGYLSKLYKLETGTNLSDYVYNLRMNKAAELLKSPQCKIYEIASILGYQNTP